MSSVARSPKSLIWPGKTALLWAQEAKGMSSVSFTLLFICVRSACALLSSYSSLDGLDGLRRSFPTKIEKAVSHRDVDSFSALNEMGNFEPPIFTFWPFIFQHLGPARVVPTTGGEHLSIRSCAVTGSPITAKANFNSPRFISCSDCGLVQGY